MGDQTMVIASRFSKAVDELQALAADEGRAGLAARHGPRLEVALRGALDAVAAVYEADTDGVRDWPERRRRVLGQLAAMRATLERGGGDDELRRMARALVQALEPASPR